MGTTHLWPWLAFAGLGAYHGINPAMGWLFAVALGLQERTRGAVLRALPPIALGHAASIAGIAALGGITQLVLPPSVVRILSAAVIFGFGLLRVLRTRHPRWVGMRVGFPDLTIWSFVMSSAHGAGLMLLPVLLQCHPAGAHSGWPLVGLVPASYAGRITPIGDPGFLAAAVGTHTLGLLIVAGTIAVIVYEKTGLALLRRAWVNLDLVWSVALAGAGIATLVI
jgi:hypothetical protein